MRVEFEMPMYTVPENNGSVYVCLTTSIGSTATTVVTVTASEKDPVSATGKSEAKTQQVLSHCSS